MKKGETGEICIYGDGVSSGYIGDHDEENKAFEKLSDGSVMYRSGDLGYILPDGNIAFLHRKDTQIMIYGKRVEVMEVESRLYQCEGVEQAIVRPFTDEEGLSYMIAYVVPSGKDFKVSHIRKELSENLTDFMIPEVRSEGIGRKIIEYLINDAKERGTEKIFLESSGVAKKLYHKIGFADMEDYMKLEDQQYADQRN